MEEKGMAACDQSQEKHSRKAAYAWVTLVMRGDNYVPGALVLAYSLKCLGTKADIICMVTNDVSTHAKEQLAAVFTRVIVVPYLEHPTGEWKTSKQKKIYSCWANQSFTKWQCLSLTEYEKVCFIDADMLAITPCDSVFQLSTPAGTFSNPWQQRHPLYANLKPGLRVSPDLVHSALTSGSAMVANGGCILLTPSKEDHIDFQRWLTRDKIFGKQWEHTCFSSKDEQSICAFYALVRKQSWTQISKNFQYLSWKPEWNDGPTIRFLHYMMRKPWMLKNDMISRADKRNEFMTWTDARLWWSVAESCLVEYPQLASSLSPLTCHLMALPSESMEHFCFYCESRKAFSEECCVHEFMQLLQKRDWASLLSQCLVHLQKGEIIQGVVSNKIDTLVMRSRTLELSHMYVVLLKPSAEWAALQEMIQSTAMDAVSDSLLPRPSSPYVLFTDAIRCLPFSLRVPILEWL